MCPTKLDIRQSISRDTLDQIATTSDKQVDALLRSINSELVMPLRMKASSPTDYILNVSSAFIANPETSRKRTIPHINQKVTSFGGGTVTFPSLSGNNITFSTGGSTPVVLTCGIGNTVKVLIFLDANGNLGARVGVEAASEALAICPSPVANTFSIGYVVAFNSAGTMSVVSNTNITHFVGGGGAGGLPVIVYTAAQASGMTLSNGIHHVIDMTTGSGNITVTAPEGETGANWKLFAVGNLNNGRNVIINANGSDKFYYNGVATNTSYQIYDLEAGIEVVWDDVDMTAWIIEKASGGGAGGGSFLDPNNESRFVYYARSDFEIDKKLFFGSTTGSDFILGLGKVTLDATQNLISSNLVGPVMLADSPIVNKIQTTLLYKDGKGDTSPVITVSRDGGTSWISSEKQEISGEVVITDFTFPESTTASFDSGVPSGSTTAYHVAAIFQPTYDFVLTSFKANLKLNASATGETIVAKIMAVSGGLPTTTLATSHETLISDEDITTTFADKTFSFDNISLEADTEYALVVEISGVATTLVVSNSATAGAFMLGSATSADGSSWSSSANDISMEIFGAGINVQVKVVSGTAASELAGFGVDMVLDQAGTYAGDANFETRIITSTEASSGTIQLNSVVFTPGANQLHCNYNGHDFIPPTFVEMGGGVVQFPVNFFVAGDVVKFFVGYGLVNVSNAPTTINNMLSSNSTLGDVTIPDGFTLDKPYMVIPTGATVSGPGNIETTGVISGDGVLATTGDVISTGYEPSQLKVDSIEELTSGGGIEVKSKIVNFFGKPGMPGETIIKNSGFGTSLVTICTQANENTWQDLNNGFTQDLTAGKWICEWRIKLDYGTTSGYIKTGRISLRDASNNILVDIIYDWVGERLGVPGVYTFIVPRHGYGTFDLTADQTVKISLMLAAYDTGGTASLAYRGDYNSSYVPSQYLKFTRIY